MRSIFRPIFGSSQVQFRSTIKPVTPFGGLVSLIEFVSKLGVAAELEKLMPFKLRSPNAIPPAQTLMAFLFSVIVGASRFAHTDWLRSDKALHAMLGIARFPGTDTIRNLFARFTQGAVELFWRPLWLWLLPHFAAPPEGFSLDLDSTIFQRQNSLFDLENGKITSKFISLKRHGVRGVGTSNFGISHPSGRSSTRTSIWPLRVSRRCSFRLLPSGSRGLVSFRPWSRLPMILRSFGA